MIASHRILSLPVRSAALTAALTLGASAVQAAPYDTAITALNPVAYYSYDNVTGDGSQVTNDAGTAGTQTITAGSTVTRANTVPGTFGVASTYTPATGYLGFSPTNAVSVYNGTTTANNLVTNGTTTPGTTVRAADVQTALSNAPAVSVSTWVSLPTLPTSTAVPTPIEIILGASGSANNTASCFQLIFSATGVRIGGRSVNSDSFLNSDTVTYAAAGITAGSFNNIVGVLDYANKQDRIYVNGVLLGTTTINYTNTALTFASGAATGGVIGLGGVYTSFSNSSGTLTSTGSNQGFTGTQDATAIFNRALTQDEITGLYNTAVPEPTSLALIGVAGVAALRRRRAR